MSTEKKGPGRRPSEFVTAVRAVAAAVPCDPRTVLVALDGGGLAINRDRVTAAVEALGLSDVFAAHANKKGS